MLGGGGVVLVFVIIYSCNVLKRKTTIQGDYCRIMKIRQ